MPRQEFTGQTNRSISDQLKKGNDIPEIRKKIIVLKISLNNALLNDKIEIDKELLEEILDYALNNQWA